VPARSRVRAGAEKPLAKPERQSLLPDPQRALEQEGGGERVPPDGIVEPASDGVVAVKWEERHGRKLRRPGPVGRVFPARRGTEPFDSLRLLRMTEAASRARNVTDSWAFDTRRERWNSG
jgi:hypothetical protein